MELERKAMLLKDWGRLASKVSDYEYAISKLTDGRASIKYLVVAIIKVTEELKDVEIQLESLGVLKEDIVKEVSLLGSE